MNVDSAVLNSVVSQISPVIASDVDSVYELDYVTGFYKCIKSSPAVSQLFGETGDCRLFITRVLTGRTLLRNSEVYEGFYINQSFIGKIYSRYVSINTGNTVSQMLFLYFRTDSSKAFAFFYPIGGNLQGEDQQLTKNYALNQSYLYSMLVDLDNNTCYDVYVSEISNPNQYHLKLTYTDWRTNLTPCIISEQRTVFKKSTDPDYVRTQLSENNRYSFAVRMRSLSGQTLWTQHTFLRIKDNRNHHLLFIYTVQDIDEQIRPLLDQFGSGDPLSSDESTKRTEVSNSIFKTMQSLPSFSDMILDQVEIEIHENYRQKLSLKQLASKYYINAAYLGQLFIQKHNCTFHDYLTDIRMEKAAELLRDTNYSIYQIAEMTGVPNSNYFHRLFRKRHHCTPLEYKFRFRAQEAADDPSGQSQTDETK